MATKTQKKSDVGKTAAEEQLENLRRRQRSEEERLAEQAEAQKAQQAEELKTKAPDGLQAALNEEGNVAAARRPNADLGAPVNGFTDQLTRRDGREPMEGHFVVIDMQADGVSDAYKAAGLTDDNGDVVDSAGNYGVYRTLGERGDDGYPKTIVVRLQDATFTDVTVPYAACRHASSRGITGGS